MKSYRPPILPSREVICKVRCGGQLHAIKLTKRGQLALIHHNGPDRENQGMSRALRALGQDKPRCFQVMDTWQEKFKNSRCPAFGGGDLPEPLREQFNLIVEGRRRRPEFSPETISKNNVQSALRDNVNRRIATLMGTEISKIQYDGCYPFQVAMNQYRSSDASISVNEKPSMERNGTRSWSRSVDLREWFRVYRRGLLSYKGRLIFEVDRYNRIPGLVRVSYVEYRPSDPYAFTVEGIDLADTEIQNMIRVPGQTKELVGAQLTS